MIGDCSGDSWQSAGAESLLGCQRDDPLRRWWGVQDDAWGSWGDGVDDWGKTIFCYTCRLGSYTCFLERNMYYCKPKIRLADRFTVQDNSGVDNKSLIWSDLSSRKFQYCSLNCQTRANTPNSSKCESDRNSSKEESKLSVSFFGWKGARALLSKKMADLHLFFSLGMFWSVSGPWMAKMWHQRCDTRLGAGRECRSVKSSFSDRQSSEKQQRKYGVRSIFG